MADFPRMNGLFWSLAHISQFLYTSRGRVSELVDDRDSKSRERKLVGVRFPPRPHAKSIKVGIHHWCCAYGRAIRLRITCDARYPRLASEILSTLHVLFPKNSVSIVRAQKNTYFNSSVYSNALAKWIPWKVGNGPKIEIYGAGCKKLRSTCKEIGFL